MLLMPGLFLSELRTRERFLPGEPTFFHERSWEDSQLGLDVGSLFQTWARERASPSNLGSCIVRKPQRRTFKEQWFNTWLAQPCYSFFKNPFRARCQLKQDTFVFSPGLCVGRDMRWTPSWPLVATCSWICILVAWLPLIDISGGSISPRCFFHDKLIKTFPWRKLRRLSYPDQNR